MIIKPSPGVRVRCPVTGQHLPDAEVEVSDADSYWMRRLQDGDVVLVVEPVSPDVKSKQTKE